MFWCLFNFLDASLCHSPQPLLFTHSCSAILLPEWSDVVLVQTSCVTAEETVCVLAHGHAAGRAWNPVPTCLPVQCAFSVTMCPGQEGLVRTGMETDVTDPRDVGFGVKG